jgi:hypothetical protein
LESRPALAAGMDASRAATRAEESLASPAGGLRTPFTLRSVVSDGAKGESKSEQVPVDFVV